MLLNKIYQWARLKPRKPALIYNDTVWDYADFAKSIAMARNALQKDELPQGATVVILARNLFTSWPIIIALRSLGLTTLAVPSLAVAETLQIRNLSRIVTTQLSYGFFKLGKHSLSGINVTILPNFVQAEIHAADMPESPDQKVVPGAHILYTSGTTGAYKKLKIDTATEEEQNFIRARALSINSGTICQSNDVQPWTSVGFRTPCAVWNAGGCVVFNQSTDETQNVFDPIRFFRHHVNLSTIIP